MALAGDRLGAARARAVAAIEDYAAEMRMAQGSRLGDGLIHTREMKDRLEAVFVEALGRFDKSGEYAADGAVDLVAWVRSKCKYSSGSAAERVTIARQLEDLPQTKKSFTTGELGYQHVAVIARTAKHVGARRRFARRRVASCGWRRRWIPTSSPARPRTSSTESMPKRFWRKRTAPTSVDI